VASTPVVTPRLIDSGVNFETWEMGPSSMTLRWRGRGVLEVSIRGHGKEEFGPLAIRRKQAVLADAGKIAIFYDFGSMPGYDSGLRVVWTQWFQAHLRSIAGIHIVVKSKIVAMGVSVVNLAVGGIIQTHTHRAGAFERALEESTK
jgi:hypothetical protein